VSEPRTLIDVLDHLERLRPSTPSPSQPLTIVLNRQIATKDNVDLGSKRHLNYVVIERANKALRYREHFASLEGFTKTRDARGSLMRLTKLPVDATTGEAMLLCSSVGRQDEEQAINAQARKRFSQTSSVSSPRLSVAPLQEPSRLVNASVVSEPSTQRLLLTTTLS
jgi:hypothetical protein